MGERGPKPGHAYGAAAVTMAIKGVNFPCTKQDLIQRYGSKEIEVKKGHPVKLSSLLNDVTDNNFNSPVDLEKAIANKI